MTNQTPSQNDMNKSLFLNLLAMLSMSALQQLGKVINPLTGKTEISLDGAQATIDMLDMLEAKTRGNRDADEDKVIKDTLTMLKMNYVETGEAAQRSEPQRPARHSQEPSDGEGGSEVSLSAEASAKAEDQRSADSGKKDKETPGQGDSKLTGDEKPETKDPKFHKSYS